MPARSPHRGGAIEPGASLPPSLAHAQTPRGASGRVSSARSAAALTSAAAASARALRPRARPRVRARVLPQAPSS